MRSTVSLILSISLVSSGLPIVAEERGVATRDRLDRGIAHEFGGPSPYALRAALIRSYEHRARLTVVLRDGTRLTGKVEQLDGATFTVMDSQGRSHTVGYTQVASVSTATKVGVAVAAIAAIVLFILWQNCFYRC
jgi:hypothetical protein